MLVANASLRGRGYKHAGSAPDMSTNSVEILTPALHLGAAGIVPHSRRIDVRFVELAATGLSTLMAGALVFATILI